MDFGVLFASYNLQYAFLNFLIGAYVSEFREKQNIVLFLLSNVISVETEIYLLAKFYVGFVKGVLS